MNVAEQDLAWRWTLERGVDFLNHGSFGACPSIVLEQQARLRALLEQQPVHFFRRELQPRLDVARDALATLVGADAQDMVFVSNATSGVNTVLRSLRLQPGDELVITDHAYAACHNALEFVARRADARVVVAKVPFPIARAEQVTEAVLAAVSDRTKLVLIDHVTSPTGLVFPLAQILPQLRARGIRSLVDGAHAPGMLPLTLRTLGADYYTGNCHKWLCAPKSVGFLYCAPEHQAELRPLVISHGASAKLDDRPRTWLEFDWVGTTDPTPILCVPAAIELLRSLSPQEGLEGHYATNRSLALKARALLCRALQIPPPCPDDMIGALAALPLPNGDATALHDALIDEDKIEVPITPWPAPPHRLVRISAQRYNRIDQYARLAEALARRL